MAIDYTGMLTGIFPEDNTAQAEALLGRQAVARNPNLLASTQMQIGESAKNLDRMRRGASGLLGTDFRSPAQKVQEELVKLNPRNVADQPKIVELLKAVDPQASFTAEAAFAQEAAQKLALQQRRESLIVQANKLGLDSTAKLLQNNGSMDEAAKQIREQEQKQVVINQGRKGKLAIARSRGAGEAVIQDIQDGKMDSLSSDEFIQTINGRSSELKTFKTPTGTAKPYPVDKSGKVLNPQTEKWVYPSELGLEQAPQLTKAINEIDQVTSKLVDFATEKFETAYDKALGAQDTLRINNELQKMITEAPILGFGSDIILNVARGLKAAGLYPNSMDDIEVTQAYAAVAAKKVLAVVASGALGSGTGISDKDVEFAKAAEGASTSLEPEAILRILRLEEQASRNLINASNLRLEKMAEFSRDGLPQTIIDQLYVPLPAPSSEVVVTTKASAFLEEARARRAAQGQ